MTPPARLGLLLTLLLACDSAPPSSPGPSLPPDGPDASRDATLDTSTPEAADQREAGADNVSTREHQVVHRACPPAPYGSEWLLVPTSTDCGPNCRTGTECVRSEDCSAKPHGRCIGLSGGRCAYASGLGDLNDVCESAADCTRGEEGDCTKHLTHTFCIYDECAVDSDCPQTDQVCQCPPEGGDPVCVTYGCSEDRDCPSGQSCRRDESYSGRAPLHHCSTANDECARDADCTLPDRDRCGFDQAQKRWICRGHIWFFG